MQVVCLTCSNAATNSWQGIRILRYEITEVTPDRGVQVAMDKQAVAERDRREQVLQVCVLAQVPSFFRFFSNAIAPP